jgi:hypothetical protein
MIFLKVDTFYYGFRQKARGIKLRTARRHVREGSLNKKGVQNTISVTKGRFKILMVDVLLGLG